MKAKEEVDIFRFMHDQVQDVTIRHGLREPQAFALWFLGMYFLGPYDIFISDGSKDGKIDAFFKTDDGRTVKHHVLNCKFTGDYPRTAPVQFYDEILAFHQAFTNRQNRDAYLAQVVKNELAPRYRDLFNRRP